MAIAANYQCWKLTMTGMKNPASYNLGLSSNVRCNYGSLFPSLSSLMEKWLNLNLTAHCCEIGLFCYGNPSYSLNFHNKVRAKKKKRNKEKKTIDFKFNFLLPQKFKLGFLWWPQFKKKMKWKKKKKLEGKHTLSLNVSCWMDSKTLELSSLSWSSSFTKQSV